MKIKLYHFVLMGILLFSGCVVYNIQVHKCITIDGNKNAPMIQGAELEGNDIKPQTEVKPNTDIKTPLN
jgi:hypothetical protein